MWKLFLGFALFAGVAVFLLRNGGTGVDMGGEKHMVDTESSAAAASAPAK